MRTEPQPVTYRDAALEILKSAERPMTASEIADAALKRGLITTRGKTPEATMSAALYRYIRDVKDASIRREFKPGPIRAVRESVRWTLSPRG
jgi:HB1, ASXL, restriction endonuclease HTH domain